MDMDIGTFVSHEVSTDPLISKLFHFITLTRIPLKNIRNSHLAKKEDITKLNCINWFTFKRWHRLIYAYQRDDAGI